MRRAQIDKSSQLIKNFAYNPSFEAAGISTLLRTNIATNPSLETAGATQAVRTNLLTNPSAETASGTVNVRTNLITNPSFEASSGVANVRTNFIANPSFEGSSGTVTTRTNLHTNPSVAVNSTGWSTYGGGNTHPDLVTSRVAAAWSLSGWAYQVQGTATSNVNMAEIGLGDYTAAAGTSFTGSIYLIASSTRKARFRFRGIGGGGDTFGADITLNASTPTRLSFTGTVPSGATGLAISIKEASVPDPFGGSDWIAGSMALVEQTAGLMPFFDGTIPAAQNLAKTATTALTGMTITTGVSYSGSTWSRAAVAAGTGGWIARQYAALNELIQRETYTASVTVTNDQAFSQSISIDWCDTNNTTYTIAPGEVRRIVVTSTRNPYSDIYRFADLQVNQSATEGRSILFKDWLIEIGTTTGEYYTGTGDYTYTWTGTVNASTSTQRATGLSFWYPTSTGVPFRSSTQKLSIGYSAGVATKGLYGDGIYVADVSGIATGNSYTFSAWVKATTSHPLTVDFRWKDSGQTIISDTLVSVTPTVGVWTRISATAVAPTGSPVYLQAMLRVFAAHTATIFYVDDALLERASGVGTYFDGSTPASGDFTYAWDTTAHASYSYQQAPVVTGWSNRWFGNFGGNGALYQANGGISGKFVRKLWTTANTGATMDAGINPNTNIAISPNTPYTISAWVRTSVAQNYNFYIEWKDATPTTLGATSQGIFTAVTANTWTRLSVTGTSPANAAFAVPVIGPYFNGLTMPYDSTMDFDNVLFEAAPGMLDYFDGANPIQNWVTNPSFETNTTGWGNGPNWTMVQNSSTYYTGTKSLSATRNNTTAGNGYVQSTINGLVAGITYTASFYVYGGSGSYNIQVRGAATNNVTQQTVFTAPGNTWSRKSVTFTAATSGSAVLYLTDDPNATPSSGTVIYLDGVMFEQSATMNPYYEGTGDFTYVWSGTANASTSLQQAPAVTGAVGVSYLGQAYQSKTYGITSGTKAIRITPTSPSNGDSFAEVNGMLSGYTFKASTTYTISGNRTILAPQTNIGGTNHFRIRIGDTELTPTVVSSVINVAGTQRVVARFTTVTGTNLGFVRFYNGSYFGGGDVWWDDIMLEEGTTNGQYFDGANQIQNLITNSNFETDTSTWTADTGAPTLTSDTAQPWIGTKSLKAVSTQASADIAVRITLSLVPRTTYTLSWYVYSPDARTAYFDVFAPTPPFSLSNQGSKAIPANTWTRVSGTFTTPADLGGSTSFYFHHGGGPTTIGTALWIDAVLLEKATTLNPYYAGLGDYTYTWVGTANASASYQSAPSVIDRQAVGGSTTITHQSSVRAQSGSKSGAIFLRGTLAADSTLMYPASEYVIGTGTGQLTANVKNTWSLWVWVPSGTGQVRLQDISSGVIGSPNTLYDQWERISVTFTGGVSGTHFLRLRTHTSIAAGTTIWWDNELIEASSGVGSYFDGSTTSNSEFTHAWTGTANASTSKQNIVSLTYGLANRDSSQVDSKFYVYQTIDESGKKIARWVSPAGTSNSTWRIAGISSSGFDYSSIKAGGVYTLFFRWRASGYITNQKVYTSIQDPNGQNAVIGQDASGSDLTLIGWQEYRRSFTAVRNGTAASMIYISLPTTPQATVNGVFDMRDWMLVEGDYKGDFIDGTKPLSRWNGTSHASTSLGYPPQLFDIAGKPTIDIVGGQTHPNSTVDGFAARTFYICYEITDMNASSWQVPFTHGTFPTVEGFTLQTDVAGSPHLAPRADFPSPGDSNSTYQISNGRTQRIHVIAMTFPQGLTSITTSLNGGVDGGKAYNPGPVGWTQGQVRAFNPTGIKTHRVLGFYANHDASTRQAISRYLGNKYGATVA